MMSVLNWSTLVFLNGHGTDELLRNGKDEIIAHLVKREKLGWAAKDVLERHEKKVATLVIVIPRKDSTTNDWLQNLYVCVWI